MSPAGHLRTTPPGTWSTWTAVCWRGAWMSRQDPRSALRAQGRGLASILPGAQGTKLRFAKALRPMRAPLTLRSNANGYPCRVQGRALVGWFGGAKRLQCSSGSTRVIRKAFGTSTWAGQGWQNDVPRRGFAYDRAGLMGAGRDCRALWLRSEVHASGRPSDLPRSKPGIRAPGRGSDASRSGHRAGHRRESKWPSPRRDWPSDGSHPAAPDRG